MHLLPLSPAPEHLPPGAPPPWPAPALVRPPPAPKGHTFLLICIALSVLGGPGCVGAVLWKTDRGDSATSAAVVILSMLVVAGLVAFYWREQRELSAKQRAHDALLKNLVTCWARVRHCAIIGSEDSADGFLTHHVLKLELEPWCDEHTLAARRTPNASECWHVCWRVAAELATRIVPDTWIAVAYNRREPNSSDTKFMQLWVALSGDVHPLV
ncbi:hypothetical protein [Corallococcus silvisoli]|uniref:hypothetical protein n=1 Tax=Corallococcus silvisoli TaxID=2697031 RepID=UPI001377649E|nr:hypothetical protein [Corallococcus silvisoli]NBD08470.1 hypothetical protein [Corallococcus silvisoli]